MLTNFQKEIMDILATTRNERSYFAGGTVLNYTLPRKSHDFDIFHDENSECIKSFVTDLGILRQNGYTYTVIRNPEQDQIGEIEVYRDDNFTQIQWVTDSSFRFFPVEKDVNFGFKLHHVDIATNKILAFAGRREQRDYYDVSTMIQCGEPVVAYVWASCAKDPGYTPYSLLDHMSLNSKYPNFDQINISNSQKISIIDCKQLFDNMKLGALENFKNAPLEDYGCLYMKKDAKTVFFPSKQDFKSHNYIKHEAQNFGIYPVIPDNQPDKAENHATRHLRMKK